MPSYTAALPSVDLLAQQARWLAPARAFLLRRAGIAHHHAVLDLGAGRGMVTAELLRRSSGTVYALDLSFDALHEINPATTLIRIVGNAHHLPLASARLDLVFSQFTLLWSGNLARCVSEIGRVLRPGGHFCAIEPDYHALIEHPSATAVAPIWLAALNRAGAIADVGRQLPGLLQGQGLDVKVRLLDELQPPSPLRFAMLRELPLTPEESGRVQAAETAAAALPGWQQLSHLPLFLIHAIRGQ
ncbi:MAG: class I SAM-dependent methyltransferase [Chloroflexota bacterium]